MKKVKSLLVRLFGWIKRNKILSLIAVVVSVKILPIVFNIVVVSWWAYDGVSRVKKHEAYMNSLPKVTSEEIRSRLNEFRGRDSDGNFLDDDKIDKLLFKMADDKYLREIIFDIAKTHQNNLENSDSLEILRQNFSRRYDNASCLNLLMGGDKEAFESNLHQVISIVEFNLEREALGILGRRKLNQTYPELFTDRSGKYFDYRNDFLKEVQNYCKVVVPTDFELKKYQERWVKNHPPKKKLKPFLNDF